MGSFSIWHWLIVLVIVALIFGTKKLRNIGEDLGGAVKGFKKGMKDASAENSANPETPAADQQRVQNKETIAVPATEKRDAANRQRTRSVNPNIHSRSVHHVPSQLYI